MASPLAVRCRHRRLALDRGDRTSECSTKLDSPGGLFAGHPRFLIQRKERERRGLYPGFWAEAFRQLPRRPWPILRALGMGPPRSFVRAVSVPTNLCVIRAPAGLFPCTRDERRGFKMSLALTLS